MAFPTGAIDLKTVCDAYSVAKNMGALRGKKYYQSPSPDAITVPTTGPISLGDFKGNYYSVTSLIVGTPPIGYIRTTPIYYSGTSGPYASIDYIIKYKTIFGSVKSIYIDRVYFSAFTSLYNIDTFYNYVGIGYDATPTSVTPDKSEAIYDRASFTSSFGTIFDNKYNNELSNFEIPINSTGRIQIVFNLFNKDFVTTRIGSNKRYSIILVLNITSSTVSLSSSPAPFGYGYP